MDRSTISNHPMSHAASRTDSLLCHSSNSRRVIASLQMACRIHCIMHRPARSLGAAGITVSELEGRKNNQFTCCWHLATIFTPPPVGERSIVMRMSVCLSVCPRAYLRNHSTTFTCPAFTEFHAMALARSSTGGVAIRYVLPVLSMTSCLHVMAMGIGDSKRRMSTQCDVTGASRISHRGV